MKLCSEAAQKNKQMQPKPALKHPSILFSYSIYLSTLLTHPLHPSPSIYPMDGEVPPLQERAL